jgi:hypothetical protein
MVVASGCSASGSAIAESTAADSIDPGSAGQGISCSAGPDAEETVSLVADATGWTVKFNVPMYQGELESFALDQTIDPAFIAASTGDHLTFTAHLPKATGDHPTCFFTSVPGVFQCMSQALDGASLDDGVRNEALSDHELFLSVEKVATDSIYGHEEHFDLRLQLPDRPGLANGYDHTASFPAWQCTAR